MNCWIAIRCCAASGQLSLQIKDVERLLANSGRQDLRVARRRTIPGIGPFFAMVLVAEIDNIQRFASPAKLPAYAGVIPSRHASGGKTYHGRIIKNSNKYLRWAMIEAAWPAIRKDGTLREIYQRIALRRGGNIAKVAVARRLLTIVYRLLTENRDYLPGTMRQTLAGLVCA